MPEEQEKRTDRLKRELSALYIAARDPRIPWYARAMIGLVAAYLFSPIDLIPDFIPGLGYLDDLVLIPFGVALAIKLIPPQVMVDARQQADERLEQGHPVIPGGAFIVIAIWLLVLALVVWLVVRHFQKEALVPLPMPL